MKNATDELRGKHALVTGGGRGIGRAIAVALGANGVDVAINYRADSDAAAATANEICAAGGRAWTVKADVSLAADVKRMFDEIAERFDRRLDILVNNAGAVTRIRLENMSEAEWDHSMATNAKSVFLCTQAALPMLPDGSGRIVNVSSISARSGGGVDSLHYAAAKAAISAFTRGCAKVLGPRGITVNAIAPGVILTDLHRFGSTEQELSDLTEKVPLKRLGTAEECAGAVLMLCTAAGGYITGETIEINGGMLMN